MNKKLKVIAAVLSVTIAVGVLSGCSGNFSKASSNVSSENKKDDKFTLAYTYIMKEQGFTEPVVLEKKPERVVCVTAATTPLLFELGASLVGIPTSSIFETPSDYKGEKLKSLMSDDFNIESVIALNPDLVIIPASGKEKHGAALESANIPVYYTNSGHSSSYDSVVEESKAIIDAFGKDSENANKVLDSFKEIEKKMEESKKALEGKKVMIISSGNYIQSKLGTAGSMADEIGLTNVYENDKAGMTPLDRETTLSYNPDIILTIGSSMSEEECKKIMQEEFEKNKEYWNSFEAVREGRVVYLPSSYMPSTGIGIIDQISNLIDKTYETLGINE